LTDRDGIASPGMNYGREPLHNDFLRPGSPSQWLLDVDVVTEPPIGRRSRLDEVAPIAADICIKPHRVVEVVGGVALVCRHELHLVATT
jgi:hypothetical protein